MAAGRAGGTTIVTMSKVRRITLLASSYNVKMHGKYTENCLIQIHNTDFYKKITNIDLKNKKW